MPIEGIAICIYGHYSSHALYPTQDIFPTKKQKYGQINYLRNHKTKTKK